MNIKQLGSHFIIGLSGTRLSDLDKRILSTLSPSGILLLKRNFEQNVPYHQWLDSLRTLLDEVHEYAEQEKLLISIDHEGGRVLRTPPPITHFPEPYYWKNNCYEVGKAMGIELSAIGVNVSWSPCCDLYTNQNNPVIGKRAFSEDASETTNCAIAFLTGLTESKMLGCIKHFPGHGDTSADSHLELPIVSSDKKTLENRELFPFSRVITHGVDLVMTAHVMYPALDPKMPATLSKPILTDILRHQLGFNGCVVTDDLDMKAISDRFSIEDTMKHALTAGCDLFIVARYPDGTSDKPLILAEVMAKLKLKDESLQISETRISSLLAKAQKNGVKELTGDLLKKHTDLSLTIKSNSNTNVGKPTPVQER